MKAIVDLLLDEGVDVTIRYRGNIAPMPPYRNVIMKPWGRLFGKLKNLVIEKWNSSLLLSFTMHFEAAILRGKYDLIFGVDRQGVIEAGWWSRYLKVPYWFLSFEIMFLCETSRRYKQLEAIAARYSSRWLIQDEVRGELLKEENNLDKKKRIVLPLASKGMGVCGMARLRDKMGIPLDKNVAIMMGSLSDWSMSPAILRSVSDWPEEWCLLVHERYGQTQKYLSKLIAEGYTIDVSRIYVSNTAVDCVDDMGDILSGVAVGLAFYSPQPFSRFTGKNLEFLGMSSGKIATFLRYGLPVVMNKIGLYAERANEHGFGVVVECPEHIGAALGQHAFAAMGDNARAYYKNSLDFTNYQHDLWRELSRSLYSEKLY